MNERIQELAEQAHCYACEYAQKPDYNPNYPYNQLVYQQRYDSKFAELIVRECADVSKNYAGGSLPLSIALAIKQHFGVEQ